MKKLTFRQNELHDPSQYIMNPIWKTRCVREETVSPSKQISSYRRGWGSARQRNRSVKRVIFYDDPPMTYCGQYVNMEVDTIRPSARRTCVWHNYSNLGRISLDVHIVWQAVCKTRACSRAWNYTPYIQVSRFLRRYVRAYNTSADQRARGSVPRGENPYLGIS